MSIAEKLSQTTLEMRKTSNPLAPSFQGIMASAQSIAKARGLKDGNTSVTDADAILAIQRGLKAVEDMLVILRDQPGSESKVATVTVEKDALLALLPARASDEEVRAAADAYIASTGADKTMKLMGPTMQHLNDTFGAALDRATASNIIKEVIAA